MNYQAAVLTAPGNPVEALTVKTLTLEEPPPGTAKVRVQYAAINPADINVLEGRYPITPGLNGIPGNEGVGIIESIHSSDCGLSAGDKVIFPSVQGAWAEYMIIPVELLVKIPDELDLQQAAMISVNPPTALLLLTQFRSLSEGDWVIQNAANSAVGQYVIKLADKMNLKTVNIVRSESWFERLQSIGATKLFLDGDDFHRQIKADQDINLLSLALNAVSGDSASKLSKTLSEGGAMVTYGAMSRQPLTASNALLIFKDISYHGFWVSRWFKQSDKQSRTDLFNQLFTLLAPEAFHVDIAAVYKLANIDQAISHASESSRSGKIILDLN